MNYKSMLSVSNITKYYDGFRVLKEVSLAINPGEVVCLIGRNGSGKTTLIKIISGLLVPNTGKVTINEKEISWSKPYLHFRSPNNLGVVYQDTRIVKGLSPSENIQLGYKPGESRNLYQALMPSIKNFNEESALKAEKLTKKFFKDELLSNSTLLSGGQKRIIELLRLSLSQPQVIIMDEPTVGLHKNAIDELISLINDFRSNGSVILISEHNLDFVERINDRVLELKEGTLLEERRHSPAKTTQKTSTNLKKTDLKKKPSGKPVILELNNLSGGYTSDVFHSFSLKVSGSEIVSFTGANGSGKSTALKAIANMTPKRGGKILFKNTDISNASPLGITDGIAFLLQTNNIFDELKVEENLIVALSQISDSRKRAKALENIYDLFPLLQNKKKKLGKELSGGERQYLAIAKCIITTPRLLLLDEPTANLNSDVVNHLRSLLKRLSKKGCAVIISEHNMEFVRQVSNQVIIFNNGEQPQVLT